MVKKPRLHFVTLGVKNLKRSRQFYKALGFEIASLSQADIVFLKAGSVILALYPRNLLAQDAAVSPQGKGFKGVTLSHNVEHKKEVARLLERAKTAGGKIVKRAQDAFWGGHSGYFFDPDGHLWEVAWNPHFAFAKDGSLKLS
jgi:predicted lactoylglutathione lyase